MKDVHFIPFNGYYLIYRPLKRLAFIGNRALVEYLQSRTEDPDTVLMQPDIEAFLDQIDFFGFATAPEDDEAFASLPAMAVLLMTNRCNLSCTYCYAAAGSHSPIDMSWPLARVVIDTAADNARINGESRFGLSFHGGGEPTVNWPVLTDAVNYARSLSLPCDISLASNGVWSPQVSDFICRNIDSVTLSFDGVRDIHDMQRPFRSGRGSFDNVLNSIRALDVAGLQYGIRMTVTAASMDRLSDGIRFLCMETDVRAIQVETSFTVAPGIYADPSSEESDRFIRAFLQAARIASEHKVFVYYSGARPWIIAQAFCLAPTRAIIATPQGRLVSCFEAADDDHPYAENFTIGRVDPDGVMPDSKSIANIRQGQASRRVACSECFCYWHCCGDCASRAMVSAAPDSMRCHINREITKSIIAGWIERSGGVWTGSDPVPDAPDISAC